MTENKKNGKQTSYLIQDIYANSLSVMPFSGNNAWLSSYRVRESKRRKWSKLKGFYTVADEPAQTSTSLPTTSGLAKRSKTSSGNKNKSVSNQSTLSMISTPWTTETSATTTLSHGETLRWQAWRAFSDSMSNSLEPGTTLTAGRSSSNGLSAYLSKESSKTSTAKERLEHVKFVNMEVPEHQRSSLDSHTLTPSWTLEAFDSTEQFSERMKVQYPWSPNTNDQIDLSIDYPSSFTLVSQKCSLDTIDGRHAVRDYTPMNHIPYSTGRHPNHDWILIKKKGITLSAV